VYRALGGGWEIREGKELVPPDVKEAMSKRTNWGGLLAPAAYNPSPSQNPNPAFGFPIGKRLIPWFEARESNPHLEMGDERQRRCDFLACPWPFNLDALPALFPLPGGVRRKGQAGAPASPAVTVAQPLRRPVTDYLELTGNTQAFKTVQLRARVSGYLDGVLFQDGQFVKEGQMLFLIQQNTYQDNLRQAEAAILLQKAQLEYAETELARYSNLLKQNAAAQTDVDNWRYQRESARPTFSRRWPNATWPNST